MCGIAGIIKKNNDIVKHNEIKSMLDVIKHRGPDAEGIYLHNSYGVGHRRLAIVDLTMDGTQPMSSSDRRFVITFNGEIYNYVELRNELKNNGVIFKTNTDTEVIMESYRMWGDQCVSKFNGMWAFALLDLQNDEVFMSRDRFGVKPLYLLDSTEEICFSSEIKSILEIKPDERIVDEQAVVRYFSGIQEDSDDITFYKNIKNFPKSTNVIYSLDGRIKKREKYWEIDIDECKKKYGKYNSYKQFLRLFEDAIRLRLRADVEVGASLSGGLDSSAIVSVAKKKFGKTMSTFSSIYKYEECNEEEFIKCVNDNNKAIPHYIYPEDNEDIITTLKDMIYYHDGPCESASPYSGYCVYKGVGKIVTVMLDGQGADELFGGYMNCFTARIKDILKRGRIVDKIHAAKLLGMFQTAIPSFRHIIDERTMVEILGYSGYRYYANYKNWSNPRNNSVSGDIYTDRFKSLYPTIKWSIPDTLDSNLKKLMYEQLFFSMLPRILHDVDRNSMASSLEVRLPFLDYRLVEFAYALDDDLKLNNSWTKYVMRKALKKYLPKKIYSRRNKMGFPAPFEHWLRDEKYKEILYEYVEKFGDRGIVKRDSAINIYEKHMAGCNLEWLLFKMISMEMWLESAIDTDKIKWKLE